MMSASVCASLAVVWRLRGVRGTVMTCCLERLPNETFELRILHNGNVQMREVHSTPDAATQRAEALARTLRLNGWTCVQDSP